MPKESLFRSPERIRRRNKGSDQNYWRKINEKQRRTKKIKRKKNQTKAKQEEKNLEGYSSKHEFLENLYYLLWFIVSYFSTGLTLRALFL